MAKTATKEVEQMLEMAEAPKRFLDSEYFQGLCEIATACATKQNIFIPEKSLGIFNSLFFKRIFGRKLNDNGSYTVGNFQMKNRYLYNWDRIAKTYSTIKEENYNKFSEKVKALANGTEEFTVFSIKQIVKSEIILTDLI